MTVAVYSRVSTQEQRIEGVSLDAQESRARAYCQLQKLGDARLFVDAGVSGSVPLGERPDGAKLVAAIASGEIRHVVAAKLDRVFRDVLDALAVTKEWDRRGVALHLVDMGGQSLNTSSAMGRLFFQITAALAECERNLTRERTRTALQHKKDRGEHLGREPLGFSAQDGQLVPVAGEIETVRLILKLRRRDPKRWSFREIAGRLEQEGHRTRKGTPWAPQTVKQVWDRRDFYRQHTP